MLNFCHDSIEFVHQSSRCRSCAECRYQLTIVIEVVLLTRFLVESLPKHVVEASIVGKDRAGVVQFVCY